MPEPDASLRNHPLGMTFDQYVPFARRELGLTRPRASLAYKNLFRTGEIADFIGPPAGVQGVLSEDSFEGKVLKFVQHVPAGDSHLGAGAASQGGPGSLATESVLIPMIGRTGTTTHTLCVSSQVGCAMGCTFCETAQMGLVRSLTPGEIVQQWWAATHLLGHRPQNVVFMGMGEPLDNIDNVIQAVGVLIDHNGAHMPVSKITVSTVGRLDGLARLSEQLHTPGWHRLNLAVSLNAPNDEVRSRIMPINRAMPMEALKQTLMKWPIYGGGKLCLEYVLIPGVNNLPGHAGEVARFVGDINTTSRNASPRCVVNLIPYNPRRNSPWEAPTDGEVDGFMGELAGAGVFVKRRRTKGRDLMGACGQLGSEHIRKRRYVDVTNSAGGTA
ncbi:MAG: 23S rRNA (adenine(2503)-C(2))-methyltransferase RlmN [Phycisphaerae bacterium]|nr:23S rRNA (adenine(2503)-C(2))-methyltransferase RlmN [Phycisphaerae bacterium]